MHKICLNLKLEGLLIIENNTFFSLTFFTNCLSLFDQFNFTFKLILYITFLVALDLRNKKGYARSSPKWKLQILPNLVLISVTGIPKVNNVAEILNFQLFQ